MLSRKHVPLDRATVHRDSKVTATRSHPVCVTQLLPSCDSSPPSCVRVCWWQTIRHLLAIWSALFMWGSRFAGELADGFRGLGNTLGGLQNCAQGGYCPSFVSIQCMEQCCVDLHWVVMTDLKGVISGISFNVYFLLHWCQTCLRKLNGWKSWVILWYWSFLRCV